jgi:hypothetical protein
VGTATAVMSGGAQPGGADPCQRSVAIDPQVTAAEANRTLSFVVQTGSCAAPGEVSFTVSGGSAQPGADFQVAEGRLRWPAGDTSPRRITVAITDDLLPEAALEDFTVTLANPTPSVRVALAVGQGRIYDNDTSARTISVDDKVCLVTGMQMRSPSPASTLTPSPSPTWLPDEDGCTIEPGHISYIKVAANKPNPGDTLVFFQTVDGELKAGLDYVPVRRNVLIPAGSTAVYVPVQLLPHAYTQSGGSFGTNLSAYTAGGVLDGNGRVTVLR